MTYILICTAIIAIVTALIRFAPFILFGNKKSTPETVSNISKLLPPAVIGMLVVYCLRNINFVGQRYFAPAEIIAGLVVIVIHCCFRNVLLSIIIGTAVNMILKQLSL